MNLPRLTTLAIIVVLCAPVLSTGAERQDSNTKQNVSKKSKKARKHYYRSFTGKVPPELRSSPDHWVNRTKGGLTLAKLKGKTIWLQFNF